MATAISNANSGNRVFAYNTATRPTLAYNIDNNNVEYGAAISGHSLSLVTGLVGDDSASTLGQTGAASFNDGYHRR